jgi:hypothetical protein
MLLELAVEIIEHDTRLDHAAVVCDIERDDAVQMLREIDDDPVIHGLAALRGATAAWRDHLPGVTADRQRPQGLIHVPGNHHSRRHDLIKRGIGRIAAAVKRIEQNLAGDFAAQTRRKRAVFSPISSVSGPRRRHWLISCEALDCLASRVSPCKAKATIRGIDRASRAGDKPVE